MGGKSEAIKKYKLIVTKYAYVKYRIGNILNSIVITMYDARWVLEILWETLCEVYDSNHSAIHLKLIQNNTVKVVYPANWLLNVKIIDRD